MRVTEASTAEPMPTSASDSEEHRPASRFRPSTLLYAIVPWLFIATGPMMLILDGALAAGLPEELIVSWLTVGLVTAGLLTIVLCTLLRVPILFGMTLHGSLLAVASLRQLPFPEAVGAYIMTGIVVAVLTVTGLTSRLVDYLPLPIVTGMVTGVLLPFGLRGVAAVAESPSVAGAALLTFLLATRWRARLGGAPPTFWAAVVGILLASIMGQANWSEFSPTIGRPVFTAPLFTARGFLELTVPLVVMVVGVHVAQSSGIMRAAGLTYATKGYTMTVGLTTTVTGLFGATPLVTMGPPLAMLLSGFPRERDEYRWSAGVLYGVLLILLGLSSPAMAGIRRWLPGPLVSIITGMAVLSVLDSYLGRAFSGRFRTGAMFAFIVTASGFSVLGIGAPLWGILAGVAVSALIEPDDFRAAAQKKT